MRPTVGAKQLLPARQLAVAPFSVVRPRRAAQLMLRASTETQQPAQAASRSTPAAPVELVPDTEFSITKISYGSILTPIGCFLLAYGFGAFFQLLPGADLSSIMLIYGFPISVLGFALAYAQLPPVPCKTTKQAFELRASQMTDIQKQIREDCTRYRYGDEQHLDEALDKIFRFGKSGGIPRKFCPTLTGLREEVTNGMYTLVLEFKSDLEMAKWEEKQPKIQSFFGPGITATISEVGPKAVDVALVCDGSGAGRSGKEAKDALPPLMPGLKARRQD